MPRDKTNYEKLKTIATLENLTINGHEESIGHMLRCANLAIKFANFLNDKNIDIELLEDCALFHDIGKLKIPKSVLYKKGKLNKKELAIVQSHSNFKFKNFRNSIIQECINWHHDNCELMPIKTLTSLSSYTKIVRLLDFYDALSYPRCYRKVRFSNKEICEEISKNIGTQFDVYYGKLFIKMLSLKLN